jgi:hypothetical protein
MTKDEMSTAHADFSSLQIVHLRVERTHVMWIDAASSAVGNNSRRQTLWQRHTVRRLARVRTQLAESAESRYMGYRFHTQESAMIPNRARVVAGTSMIGRGASR